MWKEFLALKKISKDGKIYALRMFECYFGNYSLTWEVEKVVWNFVSDIFVTKTVYIYCFTLRK